MYVAKTLQSSRCSGGALLLIIIISYRSEKSSIHRWRRRYKIYAFSLTRASPNSTVLIGTCVAESRSDGLLTAGRRQLTWLLQMRRSGTGPWRWSVWSVLLNFLLMRKLLDAHNGSRRILNMGLSSILINVDDISLTRMRSIRWLNLMDWSWSRWGVHRLIKIRVVAFSDNRNLKRLFMLPWRMPLMLSRNHQRMILFLVYWPFFYSLNWKLGIAERKDRGIYLSSCRMKVNVMLFFLNLNILTSTVIN